MIDPSALLDEAVERRLDDAAERACHELAAKINDEGAPVYLTLLKCWTEATKVLRAQLDNAERIRYDSHETCRIALSQRDEARAEVVALREALRKHAIRHASLGAVCWQCKGSWADDRPDGEMHEPGCLAEKDKGG